MLRLLPAALAAAAVVWAGSLAIGPYLVRSGEAPAASAWLYRAGAVVCHQRPDRSFHLAGLPLPVCARCTGLYASGAIAALLAWIATATEPRRGRTALLVAALPTAMTVALEWTGVAHFSNAARALASIPLGFAAGWIFVRTLRAEAIGQDAL
jgi:uncharacterized membrane protein